MKIKVLRLTGLLLSLSCITCYMAKTLEEKQPPNIVFFFVDDMGWQDTSVPFHTNTTQLNKQYYTPNMEQLAREGVKLTQAYACAVCSPSRISLMTGMSPEASCPQSSPTRSQTDAL